MAKPKSGSWLYLALIGVVFTITYSYTFNSNLNLGGDNASYYVLGKSISSGEGYKDVHIPGNPNHNHFPPGYPLILGFFMLFSSNITFLKIMSGLFLLGSSIMMFFLVKRITENDRVALVAGLLLLFNFHLLYYSSIMMSELSFIFFSLLMIYLFFKSIDQENPFKRPELYAAIVLSVFIYHIRSAGIALIGGVVLSLAFRKKWKYLGAYIVGFGLLSLPWYFRNKSLGGNSYLSQLMMKNPYRPEEGNVDFGGLFDRIIENLGRYIGKEIPNGLFAQIQVDYKADVETGQIITGLFFLGFIIFGLIKLPKYRDLMVWYILGTVAIVLLWPNVWFGVRFILPLIPFFLFFFFYGIYRFLEFLSSRLKLSTSLSPLIMLIGLFAFMPSMKLLKEQADTRMAPKYRNYFQLANWANTNLPKDAVICCRKPSLFYLYSDRKVVRYAYTDNDKELLRNMAEAGVTHVIIDQLGFSSTGRYLVPAYQKNQQKFKLVAQQPNPDTYLFEFNP